MKQAQCFWLAFTGAALPAAQEAEPAPGAVGYAVFIQSTGPQKQQAVQVESSFTVHTQSHTSIKSFGNTQHIFQSRKTSSVLWRYVAVWRSVLKRIFSEISSTNQKPDTNHLTALLFLFYSQLLDADIVPTPEMEKGKLMFLPTHSGLSPGC